MWTISKNSKRRGFTLLELMIVVMSVIIFATIPVSSIYPGLEKATITIRCNINISFTVIGFMITATFFEYKKRM